MGDLLAIASAVSYGLSDFVGGLASRRISFLRVALLGQLGGLVSVALVAPWASGGSPHVSDLLWGAASGVGTGVGMTFLFRGMSRGAMSVVVPVSSVGGAALPVFVGVAFLGDRPGLRAWIGVAVAIPALWAVSRRTPGSADPAAGSAAGPATASRVAAGDGLIAGVGIAVQYVALSRAQEASGLWPLASGRVTAILAVVTITVLASRGGRSGDGDSGDGGDGGAKLVPSGTAVLRRATRHQLRRAPAVAAVAAIAAGVLAALALACYLVATRTQLLSVAVVLSSLYPVIPVALGLTLLHERLSRTQTVGLIAALAGTVLIAA